MIRRRTVVAALPAALTLPALAQPVFNRALRIVVPFAPGGSSDILARLMAPKLTEALGQTVVVENRAGANGHIGAEAVARAQKDGHTLLITDVSSLAIAPSLLKSMPYDPLKDLAPVTMVAFAPYIFGVHPSVPATDVPSFVAHAKANPGKLNLAHSGIGAANHLTGIVLAKHFGFTWEYVPYRGGAAAIQAVVQNDCQALLNGATATQPFVTSGQLRGIAVSGTERLPALPETRNFGELGLPKLLVESGTWQGILTTGGTPAPVVAALHRAVTGVLADAAIVERINQIGGGVRTMQPEAFGAWLAASTQDWGHVVRENNVTVE
ncbi:MAG: tripartite tricarboxylate transporter substrate binding protein [Burkholderiales bacterium]|nr:tripartite tricarboxylate transporter substrate binding protein [Burkholderiales bacterium]